MSISEALLNIPWSVGTVLSILLLMLFTVGGLLIVRRKIGVINLRRHHDVAGYVFCNLGVLYSVLLGFTVVNVQQRFDRVKETLETEAGYLVELHRDAAIFPENERLKIQSAILSYAESVLHEEWPEMQKRTATFRPSTSFKQVWHSYYALEPKSIREQVWYAESIRKLNEVMNVRLQRLLGSRESLGFEMWTLLVTGALVMATFLWFFGLESITSHILMASLLTASLSFLLFLIFSLDTTFSGDVSISPEVFEKVIATLKAGT